MPEEQSSSDVKSAHSRGRRRWLRAALIAIFGVVAVFAIVLANHNFRIAGQSRSEFEKRLDRSLAAAIDYLDSRRMELVQYNPNCALTYMIRDMSRLDGDERLNPLVEGYANKLPEYYWLRMVYSEPGKQEDLQVDDLPRVELGNLTDDQRWFYYVLGGTGIKLEDEELDLLMSATDCTARKLTHQLFALNLLQHRNPNDEKLKELRAALCERIAQEAVWETRVGDMLYQRIAFLLMSGRDDLIQPRWVERVISFQQADGGWGFAYRPQIIKAMLGEQPSNEHASVQAAWLLCQLKHRYPQWIERHYSN